MEVNAMQVHELHKKFEVLNDEITQALRRQEDAISSTAAATGSGNSTADPPISRKNVLRLTTRAIDWREDVNALAKHIDVQLQNSRALRAREAEVLPRDVDSKQTIEDDDSAKLQCLRSDIRLLQSFRVVHVHATTRSDNKAFAATLQALDADGKLQKSLLDQSIKAEKSGRKEIQTAMILQLFEVRRELMGKISEHVLKDTKQIDDDTGLSDLLSVGARSGVGGGGSSDKGDILASLDAQLYLRLVHALLELERDRRARFSDSSFTQQQQQLRYGVTSHDVPDESSAVTAVDSQSPATSFSTATSSTAVKTAGGSTAETPSLDEVTFALQKLRRDHAELKQSHARLEMAYSQREDDVAHLQRKYDDERRAHIQETKWYEPKIQKLEETVVTTARAFDALQLNVELLTNMYKSLRQTLHALALKEDELKRERDGVTMLLSDEIKKVALLTRENVRQEKLVLIAMSARHAMCAETKQSENRRKDLEKEKREAELRAKESTEELNVATVQLQCAYSRLGASDDALACAKATIERLQQEMEVCLQAGRVKEAELKTVYEAQMQTLQQRFDKTKRELMDAMSQNLALDGRLRKAQEKLNKIVNGDAAKAKDPSS
jgi:hypothetical protein